MEYLLDTNVLVAASRGNTFIQNKINTIGASQCYISEITLAELYYGAACSLRPEQNTSKVEALCSCLNILNISPVLKKFAEEKSKLRTSGEMIEDADIFVGSTALFYGLTLATGNTKHLGRMQGLELENWF